MSISLPSISGLITTSGPYVPLIAVGVLAVVAIAAVYFLYIKASAAAPADNPAGVDPAPAEPLPARQSPHKSFETAAETLALNPQLRSAVGQLGNLFAMHLQEVSSSDETTELIKAFITKAKQIVPDARHNRFIFDQLPRIFEPLWTCEHADLSQLFQTLGGLGVTNAPILIESGKEILKDLLKEADSFERALFINSRLDQLRAPNERIVTAHAMREEIVDYRPLNAQCQTALQLHRCLQQLTTNYIRIKSSDLTQAISQFITVPDEQLRAIKNSESDATRTSLIHTYTDSEEVENPFTPLFENEYLGPALNEALRALSIHIERSPKQYRFGAEDKMEDLIYFAIGMDLLSLAAGLDHRDFRVDMAIDEDRMLAEAAVEGHRDAQFEADRALAARLAAGEG